MLWVVVAWIYVVLMMTVAEATSSQGSWLGAAVTLLIYGVLPLAIVFLVAGLRARRRAPPAPTSAAESDHRDMAAGDAVAPEGEESRRV
jgi:hypothetical protein